MLDLVAACDYVWHEAERWHCHGHHDAVVQLLFVGVLGKMGLN